MSDFERDAGVTNLLLMAGDEATRFVQPEGVGAVVSTVRHRRRNRMVAIAVLALALIGGPLTAVNLAGVHGTPPVGNVPPTASAAPSNSPTPAPSASTQPAAPDGRMSLDELRTATVTVPAWPKGFDDGCATGRVRFTNGKSGAVALQGAPVYVDLDHDGAMETVVLLSCSPQGTDYKVLALDRDGSGAIVTIGQVVGSAGNTGRQGVDIMTIWGIEAGDNGQVRVDVGEYRPCCDEAQASQHQWRVYGWNGTAFTQTSGPTAFGPNPNVTDLVVTAAPLTMVKQPNDSYLGTLHVTIHNAARYPTPGQLEFAIGVPNSWVVQPVAGSACQLDGAQPQSCRLPVLAAGADRVIDLQISVLPGADRGSCTLYRHAVDANGLAYPDRAPGAGTTVQVTWS
jgi:hypothetical protein